MAARVTQDWLEAAIEPAAAARATQTTLEAGVSVTPAARATLVFLEVSVPSQEAPFVFNNPVTF